MKNPIFFTPGPSQLFPTYRRHLAEALERNIPSISHRSDTFHKIFNDTTSSLRTLLSIPKDFHIFFVSSATEAMEQIIQSSVKEKSFHLVNGAFSRLFYTIALAHGKHAQKYEVAAGMGFDFPNVHIPRDTELLCVTHNETSTGVSLPPDRLYDLRVRYPRALIALDIVSSVPCVNMDLSRFDTIFFSVQKGLGLPAGLGVLIVSPRAIEKAQYIEKRVKTVGSFHRFTNLLAYAQKYETPETPNVLEIFLLGNVAQDFSRIGIQAIRKQITEKATLLYTFFDHDDHYTPFVTQKIFRSPTVIVVGVANGSERLVSSLSQKGLVVGKGYKEFKSTHIRIANFPAHTAAHMKRLISELT